MFMGSEAPFEARHWVLVLPAKVAVSIVLMKRDQLLLSGLDGCRDVVGEGAGSQYLEDR
jgi:hypothetical protein